jgi:dUTP pyrophosphatase
MKIKFKRLHKDAKFPEKASDLAGGWDVVATEMDDKNSQDFMICKLGFALEIPEGYRLILVPRSSLTKTYWIMQNSPGLGDADYRGEYQFRFRCIPVDTAREDLYYMKFPYLVGDRIGQVYLEKVIPMEFVEVDELDDSTRGEGGFGSTGTK